MDVRYPTGLTLRGHFDRGDRVGTWIGTRDGVATAIVHGELAMGTGARTWRVFDAAGNLTFERVLRDDGATATGWSAGGVRLAEYDCAKDGGVTEARFYDDRGKLARRYKPATTYPARATLTDATGAEVALSAKHSRFMEGVRDACGGPLWFLEGPPPSREPAFGRDP